MHHNVVTRRWSINLVSLLTGNSPLPLARPKMLQFSFCTSTNSKRRRFPLRVAINLWSDEHWTILFKIFSEVLSKCSIFGIFLVRYQLSRPLKILHKYWNAPRDHSSATFNYTFHLFKLGSLPCLSWVQLLMLAQKQQLSVFAAAPYIRGCAEKPKQHKHLLLLCHQT